MNADLARFLEAQAGVYETALSEIASGAKRSHWMWFIFPQLRGLGHSFMAQRYGIIDLAEAREYVAHSVLGTRYAQCLEALQALHGSDPVAIFGGIDAVKLRSSLTLFETASALPLIPETLDRWFDGVRDPETIRRLS